MNHEVDLKNYFVRTDLAIETLNDNIKKKNYKKVTKHYKDIEVTKIFLSNEAACKINKKEGNYITISFEDVTDTNNLNKVLKVFKRELAKIIPKISKKDLVLVVGLGNASSTPDSLGPKTIDKINVTNHLYEMGICDSNYQKVAVLKPGVTGETGVETNKQIKAIANVLNPKLIIVIDALASGSIDRVNKTIQITDTGIHPGSGIGNEREEISFETLSIPVIAIGVPTVVDAINIVSDTINYMYKHYSFAKKNMDKGKYKLTIGSVNLTKKKINVNNEEKETLFGLIGKLDTNELKSLLNEVLTPVGYNLMVTPKEIDFIIDKLVQIISKGINEIFYK